MGKKIIHFEVRNFYHQTGEVSKKQALEFLGLPEDSNELDLVVYKCPYILETKRGVQVRTKNKLGELLNPNYVVDEDYDSCCYECGGGGGYSLIISGEIELDEEATEALEFKKDRERKKELETKKKIEKAEKEELKKLLKKYPEMKK